MKQVASSGRYFIDASLVESIADAEQINLGRTTFSVDPVWYSSIAAEGFDSFHHELVANKNPLEIDVWIANWVTQFIRNKTGQEPGAVSRVAHPSARRAKEYIWSRAEENFQLSELAGAVGMSRYELVRQFKAAYGLPPHAWQLQVRVDRSKRLLRKGIALGEVALRLGFSDQAHFSRVFRKATGYPPGKFCSEFRNSVQDFSSDTTKNGE